MNIFCSIPDSSFCLKANSRVDLLMSLSRASDVCLADNILRLFCADHNTSSVRSPSVYMFTSLYFTELWPAEKRQEYVDSYKWQELKMCIYDVYLWKYGGYDCLFQGNIQTSIANVPKKHVQQWNIYKMPLKVNYCSSHSSERIVRGICYKSTL